MLRSKKHIFIAFFLGLLFVVYQVCLTVFSHVHYVNGVMVVHSHPSKDSHHTHSKNSVLTLAQVTSFMGVEPSETLLPKAEQPLLFCWRAYPVLEHPSGGFSHHIRLRGPPFTVFG